MEDFLIPYGSRHGVRDLQFDIRCPVPGIVIAAL